nr:dual specificity [Hymenolepis microstoma]
MAYVAIPNLYLPGSQNNNNIPNSSYKYRQRRPYYKGTSFHRTYENSLGSWENVSSALNNYENAYKESQVKLSSDWRRPARSSRRCSHSVEAAPFILHQHNYSKLNDFNSSKYPLESSFSKRTNSQPNFKQPARLTQLKTSNNDQYRLPTYNALKNYSFTGSTSLLRKYSPRRESSLYSDRSHTFRNSKTFRNTSEGPIISKEQQKETNRFRGSFIDSPSNSSSKYALDEFSRNDEHHKGDMLKGRYQIVHEIGRGSFGNVYKAIDTETGKFCAIKCIKHISNFQKLAEEEISILEMLSSQDTNDSFNFLHLNDHFTTPDHTYMVFDLLSINLFQLVHRNNYRGFDPKLVKKFVRCILNCLQFLHKRSRFYRAPEVIFGCDYDTAIDMWSLGCIAVELLTGAPVFPGEDEQDQIACIMEVLGLPPSSVMRKIRRPHHFFTDEGEPRYLVEGREKMANKLYHRSNRMNRADPGVLTLKALLKNSMGEEGLDPQLIDFLSRCLCWDPQERITAREALRHPWICANEISDLDNGSASKNDVPTSSSDEW